MTQFFADDKLMPFEQAPKDWEPSWLVENLLLKGGLNFIAGAPKVHKSMLRRYLLACLTTQRPVFDALTVLESPKRVLAMLSEDHPGAERRFIECTLTALESPRRPELDFVEPLGFDFADPTHVAELVAAIKRRGYELVTVDPLVNFNTADENVASEVGKVVNHLRWVIKETGVTVVVIHHDSKQSSNPEDTRATIHKLRGSGVLGGAADTQTYVKRSGAGQLHSVERAGKHHTDSETIENVMLDTETWLWRQRDALTETRVVEFVKLHPKLIVREIARKLGHRDIKVREMLNQLVKKGKLVRERDIDTRREEYCVPI